MTFPRRPRAQRKAETPCCEAEAPSPLQPFYTTRVSCTGSELLCKSSAGAASASSLALTCKATVSDVEHESEVHVSVILLPILLLLFVTVLLSLALLLLLRPGVLCLANTRNRACLTVLCRKTDRCRPCPISCQRDSLPKPLLEKPQPAPCSAAANHPPLPAGPTVCTASTGSAHRNGVLLPLVGPEHHQKTRTNCCGCRQLPRLCSRPCSGDPPYHFLPQSLFTPHLV